MLGALLGIVLGICWTVTYLALAEKLCEVT